MNRTYRIVFNRTLGVPQVVSELASAPNGATLGAVDRLPRMRPKARLLATTVGLALATVALPSWAQNCTQTSGTVGTSCVGTTSTNGATGKGGTGGSPVANGSGTGGSAGTAGLGGAFGGNGGSANLYPNSTYSGGGGGGGGVYGGGGGSGAAGTYYGAGGAGGGGGNPGIIAAGNLAIDSGTTVIGGSGDAGAPDLNYNDFGGGGGGGAAGVGFAISGSTLSNAGTIAGGSGGVGGQAYLGGAGGGGGMALSISGTGNQATNSGLLVGGAGGAGAAGTGYYPGNGGGGGAGLSLGGTGNTVTNAGGITGGGGGAGGVSNGYYGYRTAVAGSGGVGAGIAGNNNTLVTSGNISGGLDGTGNNRALAVDITGSNNTLELDSGYSFTGDVVSTAGNGNVLSLGGNTDDSFAVSDIGSTFTGFDGYLKSGASTWTLTGTTTALTPWTINAGTLAISDDASLGDSAGGLALDGGTLETTADVTSARAITLGNAGGTFNTDTGTLLTLNGALTDNVGLTKSGSGTLVLAGLANVDGAMSVTGGELDLNGDGSSFAGGFSMSGGTKLLLGGAGAGVTVSGVHGAPGTPGGTFNPVGKYFMGGAGGNGSVGGTAVNGSGFVLNNNSQITGGIGGAGGSGKYAHAVSGSGGAGAAGGAGVSGTGFTLTNTGMIAGGAGGAGGIGGAGLSGAGSAANGSGYSGGAGGSGGAGISGSSFTLINSGSIVGGAGVTGGAGGAGGSNNGSTPNGSVGADGVGGAGGVGVISTGNAIVINRGSIAGGVDADGAQADAVSLSGGNNTLEIDAGYSFTGKVVSTSGSTQGGDTLALGGNTDASFNVGDVGAVGSAAGFEGFAKIAKTGSSTWTLTGTGNANQAWTIAEGTLSGSATSLVGNMHFAPATGTTAMVTFDQVQDGSFNGIVSGDGVIQKTGNAALTLNGANTYSGGTALDAGTLVLGNAAAIGSGTLAMAQNTTLVFTSGFTLGNAITLSGDPTINVNAGQTTTLSGGIGDGTQSGDLVKTGTGTLVLTGTDTYTGSTEAAAGTLDVEGSLVSRVTVDSGATLTGGGSVGGMTIANGSTVSPSGGAIGTLTVHGNASLAAGSLYQLDATNAGSSDLIHATGSAKLGGGSVVSLASGSNWSVSTKYTILTADSGVSGTFGSATSNFVFLTPTLSYDANHAYLTLVRNITSFPSVGVTPNEIQTGGAIEAMGSGNALYDAVLALSAAQAQAAFNQLAGDSLASTRTAIVDDSHYVRDAINNHLQGLDGSGTVAQSDDNGSVWASTWSHGGGHDSDGNAARMSSNGSGLLLGADRDLGMWRLGAVAGSGQLSDHSRNAPDDAHSTDTVLGLYTGVDQGAWQLQGGAAHSWYQTESHRHLDVAGLAGIATAKYATGVTQAYVDGGYQFTFERGSLTPYVNAARLWAHQDAINESAIAGLDVQANGSNVNEATVGLRGLYQPLAYLQVHASLGYHHAWGDLASLDQQRFANGGVESFSVSGLPVAKNASVFDLGARISLSKNVSIDASYHGQFASKATDQGAHMSLNIRF